jgi:hypothetical protein
MLVLLALCGCGPSSPTTDARPDTGADTSADTAGTDDTGPTPDTGPADLDGDGAPETTDCDDRNPDVYPGAEEAWNDVDDDCDGRVDADGGWVGTVALRATAVYEGRPYNFSLDCPLEGTRSLGVLDFAITCTPDPSDEDAQRLLGASLVITPDDTDVVGDTWEDQAVFTSSNGWDSDGEGQVRWSDYDTAEVTVSMAGVSLQASGAGDLARL